MRIGPGLTPAISRVKIFDPGQVFLNYFSVHPSPSTWDVGKTRSSVIMTEVFVNETLCKNLLSFHKEMISA